MSYSVSDNFSNEDIFEEPSSVSENGLIPDTAETEAKLLSADFFDSISQNQLDLIDQLNSISDDLSIIAVNSTGQFIPTQYVEYMGSILKWSDLDDYYCCFSSQYFASYNRYVTYYTMVVSDSLDLTGLHLSGSDCDIYEFYPTEHSPNYVHYIDDVDIYLSDGFCITDLSSAYPTLSSQSDRYASFTFFLLVFICIFLTITAFGRVSARIRRRARRRKIL